MDKNDIHIFMKQYNDYKGISEVLFTELFCKAFKTRQVEVHQTAVDHGWWYDEFKEYSPDIFNKGEKIALMHSELSEALEALRLPSENKSEKIPEFNHVEEELADCIIRIMDFAEAYGYNVAEAVVAKAEYNKSRPFKHGGKKF